jgi:hypothetical protein
MPPDELDEAVIKFVDSQNATWESNAYNDAIPTFTNSTTTYNGVYGAISRLINDLYVAGKWPTSPQFRPKLRGMVCLAMPDTVNLPPGEDPGVNDAEREIISGNLPGAKVWIGPTWDDSAKNSPDGKNGALFDVLGDIFYYWFLDPLNGGVNSEDSDLIIYIETAGGPPAQGQPDESYLNSNSGQTGEGNDRDFVLVQHWRAAEVQKVTYANASPFDLVAHSYDYVLKGNTVYTVRGVGPDGVTGTISLLEDGIVIDSHQAIRDHTVVDTNIAFALGSRYLAGGSWLIDGTIGIWAIGEAGVSDPTLAKIFKRFMYDLAVDAQILLPDIWDNSTSPIPLMPFSAESGGQSDDSRVSVKESGYKLIREMGGNFVYAFEIWRYHEKTNPLFETEDPDDPDNPAYNWDIADEMFRLADVYDLDIALAMAFTLISFPHVPEWAFVPGDTELFGPPGNLTRIDNGNSTYDAEWTGLAHGLFLGQEIDMGGAFPPEFRADDTVVTAVIDETTFRFRLDEDPIDASSTGNAWIRVNQGQGLINCIGWREGYQNFLTAFMTRYADKTRLKWHICSDFAWPFFDGLSNPEFSVFKDHVETCVNITSSIHSGCKTGISSRIQIGEGQQVLDRFVALADVCDVLWATWYPQIDIDFKGSPEEPYDRASWDLQYQRTFDYFDATGKPWGWIECFFSSDDSVGVVFEGTAEQSREFSEFMLAKGEEHAVYFRGMGTFHSPGVNFLYQFSDNCDYDSGIFFPLFTGDTQEWVDGIGLFYKLGPAETIMVDANSPPSPNKQLQTTHDELFNRARKQ